MAGSLDSPPRMRSTPTATRAPTPLDDATVSLQDVQRPRQRTRVFDTKSLSDADGRCPSARNHGQNVFGRHETTPCVVLSATSSVACSVVLYVYSLDEHMDARNPSSSPSMATPPKFGADHQPGTGWSAGMAYHCTDNGNLVNSFRRGAQI